MIAATSTIIKEENQDSVCIYCGGKLVGDWEHKIISGLEYKIRRCENGHEARIKTSCLLAIDHIVKVHSMDWGTIKANRY